MLRLGTLENMGYGRSFWPKNTRFIEIFMGSDRKGLVNTWGDALALLDRTRQASWADLLVIGGLGAVVYSMVHLAGHWSAEFHSTVNIELSPWYLPQYTFYSVARGLLAYCCSLLFTLIYGYWAAKDRLAERVLIPLLDILQSIPVLGFMPTLVLALIALFPHNNVGLELVAILMIFTGQAWNMTFSFYHSVKSVPQDQIEVSIVYRFSRWERLKWVELPYSTMGLVWNSMMSMAGGWFFLMICESFQLGNRDFRLPGLGAYMSEAVNQGNVAAMIWAILAMTLAIVALDQFLWRPVVVWAQKFRVEEGGATEAMSSWFLDFLRHSHLLSIVQAAYHKQQWQRSARRRAAVAAPPGRGHRANLLSWMSIAAFLLLSAGIAWGVWQLVLLLRNVALPQWGHIFLAAGSTLLRVLISVAIGTVWALPAGLAIGLSPRLSRIFQPVVQVVASFPAPMLFPMVIAVFTFLGVTLNYGSVVLMLLGTQWYILFNVIAGAMAIPADLKEMSRSYRIAGVRRFWNLYFPSMFPYLVTGWVTATGGAWNASIVAEYMTFRGDTLHAFGLGEMISAAAAGSPGSGGTPDYPVLAASILIMATMVVLFNRLVWRRLYRLADECYSLSK
jgi:NitT/TauT family transport system permease protein